MEAPQELRTTLGRWKHSHTMVDFAIGGGWNSHLGHESPSCPRREALEEFIAELGLSGASRQNLPTGKEATAPLQE